MIPHIIHRPDGRWQINYCTLKGTRSKRIFKDKYKADVFLDWAIAIKQYIIIK